MLRCIAPSMRSDAFRLRNGAHHAVEDDAVGSSRLRSSSRMTPRMMSSLTSWPASMTARACEAERGAALDGVTQEIAGRELGNAERRGKQRALGPLAGAGRAEEEDIHGRVNSETS